MTRGAWRRTVAAAAVALAGCDRGAGGGTTGGGAAAPPAGPPRVGDPAPAYAAVTPAGDSVSLRAYRDSAPGGAAVLLNVWATWCGPCRAEIPALDTLQRRHGARGLRVVGVSVDADRPAAEVERHARRLGASYAVWLDPDDRVSALLGAYGVPATVLVDRAGVVRWRHAGPVTAGDPALARALDAALGAPLGAN